MITFYNKMGFGIRIDKSGCTIRGYVYLDFNISPLSMCMLQASVMSQRI